MTDWKPADIAKIWIASGGSRLTGILVNCVSVALAESGGDDHAVSNSGDYGLWQINRIHFGDGIIDATNWWSPYWNAREAIRLSGNGDNWAAWCTAWVNPRVNCGHGYLHSPQPGSPAYDQEQVAIPALNAAGLVGGTGVAPVLPVSPPDSLNGVWGSVQNYVSTGAPGQYVTLHRLGSAISQIAR